MDVRIDLDVRGTAFQEPFKGIELLEVFESMEVERVLLPLLQNTTEMFPGRKVVLDFQLHTV